MQRSVLHTTFILIGVLAILYGSSLLEQSHAEYYVPAKITKVDSKEYMGRLENLLHVSYEVDDQKYTKTLRTSDCVFFEEQIVHLVYNTDPEDAEFPNMTLYVDAWSCIGFGAMLILV